MKTRLDLSTIRQTTIFALVLALVTLFVPTLNAEQPEPITDTQPAVVIEQEQPEVPSLEQQLADNPKASAQEMSHQPCIQVITWGKHPGTGECVQFPTPCDVPQGWESFSSLEECQAAC